MTLTVPGGQGGVATVLRAGQSGSVPLPREKISGEIPVTTLTACLVCGVALPVGSAVGRPRKRCTVCAADKQALGRHWRATHPDRVLAYREKARARLQAERRAAYEDRAQQIVRGLRRQHAATANVEVTT